MRVVIIISVIVLADVALQIAGIPKLNSLTTTMILCWTIIWAAIGDLVTWFKGN